MFKEAGTFATKSEIVDRVLGIPLTRISLGMTDVRGSCVAQCLGEELY